MPKAPFKLTICKKLASLLRTRQPTSQLLGLASWLPSKKRLASLAIQASLSIWEQIVFFTNRAPKYTFTIVGSLVRLLHPRLLLFRYSQALPLLLSKCLAFDYRLATTAKFQKYLLNLPHKLYLSDRNQQAYFLPQFSLFIQRTYKQTPIDQMTSQIHIS